MFEGKTPGDQTGVVRIQEVTRQTWKSVAPTVRGHLRMKFLLPWSQKPSAAGHASKYNLHNSTGNGKLNARLWWYCARN